MTGIANYTLHIIGSLLEQTTSYRYVGFGRSGWRDLDLAATQQVGGEHGGPPDDGSLRGSLSRDMANLFSRMAMRYARSSALAFYRALYRGGFAATVGGQKLDLFHAFNFRPPADPGAPVLPVVYDLSTFRHPEFHPADRVRWLAPLAEIVARAPMVQTISEFSKREIMDVFGTAAEKIFVAPPAAAPLFKPAGLESSRQDLAAFGLAYGDFFLTVGTLEPRKNVRTLIAAYGQLSPAERSRCQMVVVGGQGWGDLDLPTQAESFIRDGTLRFLAGINNPQLRSLYESARLVLMPSLYEGFGMPIVEALACGTPVAHSADTSMDEISGDFGRRIPALDVDGWTDALRQALAGDDHCDEILREARIKQARVFDWDQSAGLVAAAYRQLIGG